MIFLYLLIYPINTYAFICFCISFLCTFFSPITFRTDVSIYLSVLCIFRICLCVCIDVCDSHLNKSEYTRTELHILYKGMPFNNFVKNSNRARCLYKPVCKFWKGHSLLLEQTRNAPNLYIYYIKYQNYSKKYTKNFEIFLNNFLYYRVIVLLAKKLNLSHIFLQIGKCLAKLSKKCLL